MNKILAVIGLGCAVAGCAAIFDGTTQQIAVNTTPPDARCKFTRNGSVIADISSTPSAVTIQKTKHDITIVCSKAGYEDASFVNKSGVAGATFANILGGVVTGGIAWAVDSGSGADNKYEGQINMSLTPSGFASPTAVPGANPAAQSPTASRSAVVAPTPAAGEIECVSASGIHLRLAVATCPPPLTPAQ